MTSEINDRTKLLPEDQAPAKMWRMCASDLLEGASHPIRGYVILTDNQSLKPHSPRSQIAWFAGDAIVVLVEQHPHYFGPKPSTKNAVERNILVKTDFGHKAFWTLASRTIPSELQEERGVFELQVDTEHSTVAASDPKLLEASVDSQVNNLFGMAPQFAFDDEAEIAFSEQLLTILHRYKGMALNEIYYLIVNARLSSELVESALRTLGGMDQTSTHNYRRWVLEKLLLKGESPVVRDAANIGLSNMDDPHAIPFFKKAIDQEAIPLLQKMMRKTLVQLEETQTCRSSCT